MTDQKALKRRIRARMTKTGESYTTARRQILAKSPLPDTAAHPTTEPPAAEFRGRAPSDDLVVARTGKPWAEWLALLEAWGAAERSHTEIARWLNAERGVEGWWSQELTVRYEMAIGRRQPGQRPDGFSVGVSKTVAVPVARLFEAFVDEPMRATWLPGATMRTRTATPHRHARFDWEDGASRLAVYFSPKDEARSTVTVQHERLPDADTAERMRAFWRTSLAALERTVEAGG